jgi:hypothetical protein
MPAARNIKQPLRGRENIMKGFRKPERELATDDRLELLEQVRNPFCTMTGRDSRFVLPRDHARVEAGKQAPECAWRCQFDCLLPRDCQ